MHYKRAILSIDGNTDFNYLQSRNSYSFSIPRLTAIYNSLIVCRNLLQTLFLTALAPFAQSANAAPPRVELPAGREIPLEARQYFSEAVASIASQIGDQFIARLAIYETTPNLPSGIPGNPAKDYTSNRRGKDATSCGVFQPALPEGRPYALCPLPGEVPTDFTARECCRHYAFAVPYSKFGLAVEDRFTTIIVSSRLFLLPRERWEAILAHELGHAVDFYLFGSKYRLLNHKPSKASPELLDQMKLIDEFENDAELRADALGELLVLKPRKQKLCYDPLLTLQILTDPSDMCKGDVSGTALMRHYSHPPLQG